MRKCHFLAALLAVATGAAGAEAADPANSLSVVTPNGDNYGPCTQSAPCSDLATAVRMTKAGGEVLLYGSPLITQSVAIQRAVTIRAVGGRAQLFVAAININAGPSDRVVIDGIDFYGGGGDPGETLLGIGVLQASEVFIRNCSFAGYLDRADGFVTAGLELINTSATVRVTVSNSAFLDNVNGIAVLSGAGLGHVKMFDASVSSNRDAGIRVVGAGNDVLLSNVAITGSPKGLDLQSGAKATSYGNNVITNGDAPTKLPLN
jgi:hypothetical protein